VSINFAYLVIRTSYIVTRTILNKIYRGYTFGCTEAVDKTSDDNNGNIEKKMKMKKKKGLESTKRVRPLSCIPILLQYEVFVFPWKMESTRIIQCLSQLGFVTGICEVFRRDRRSVKFFCKRYLRITHKTETPQGVILWHKLTF